MHEPHGLVEHAAEIPYAVVVAPELSLEGCPWHYYPESLIGETRFEPLLMNLALCPDERL